MFGIIGDVFGLVGDIGKCVARRSIGYRAGSSCSAEALEVALFAFQKYDKNRKKATRLMNEGEIKEYDRLLKEYPGGYAEYRAAMDKSAEESRLRYEARCAEDPLGAWVEDLANEENVMKAEAEWDMAVDREHGIYRPRSSYGL